MDEESKGEKIRVGVIGGGFGRNHILAYRTCPDVEMAAFCQRSRSGAEKIAREFRIPHVFTDYRELLAVKDLDAVSIAAPVHLHRPIALEAFRRGLHVLCEKPLALNRGEAEIMFARAEETGRVHMTAFNFRFIPALMRMKELLGERYVGSIFHVDVVWFAERRADPDEPMGWRYRSETAGVGAMGDMGVHAIDLVRWLVGEFKKVCGHAAIFIGERSLPDGSGRGSVTTEDSCAFMAELAGGTQATAHVSGVARGGAYQSVAIFGSDGMLRLEIDRRLPDWIEGKLWGSKGLGTASEVLPIPERLTGGLNLAERERAMGEFVFANLTRRFAEAIKRGGEAVPSFRDGLEAQKVVDAVMRSVGTQSWVSVA